MPYTPSLRSILATVAASCALANTACDPSNAGPRGPGGTLEGETPSGGSPTRDAGEGGTPRSTAPPTWLDVPGERLPPLPRASTAETAQFVTSDRCTPCHTANDGPALRDARGRDISPGGRWRASLMAQAARDPFYLAAFAAELDARPRATVAIERTCTRCHAPAASVATGHVRFDDLVKADGFEATLARDGVNCSLCHQIEERGLGSPRSFTGGFTVGDQRLLYGPHASPETAPMQTFVNFTPTYSAHVTKSALCASCHTVITRALDANGTPVGPDFAEQATYLEWQNSAFRDEGELTEHSTSCQGCHMPTVDEDGNALRSVLATRPPTLLPRSPLGRHEFAGGNAYVLELFAADTAYFGTFVKAEDFAAQAALATQMLTKAAKVSVLRAARVGGALEVVVRVDNTSGHRFPTGYPSRRAVIELRVFDANERLVFGSGRLDAHGRLVDAAGGVLESMDSPLPHRDVIERDDEVQVYESVPADDSGGVAHSLLSATGYSKDNRLLPRGHSPTHANALLAGPVGVGADPSFVAGSDEVTYRIANAPLGPLRVALRLLYQPVRPTEIEALAKRPSPAARRFFDMVAKKPPTAFVVASLEARVP
jgi:hypothetical protein